MTLELLCAVCRLAPPNRLGTYLPYLNDTLLEFFITTPDRIAAFLGQVAHESGEFRYTEELASGEAYEGRTDLGNTHPGDGRRYKGRGLLQITGRANYAACGKALGVDLEQSPERLADYDLATRSAGWFWATHRLNELADRGADAEGTLESITRRINGGLNGLDDRKKYTDRALAVLGGT